MRGKSKLEIVAGRFGTFPQSLHLIVLPVPLSVPYTVTVYTVGSSNDCLGLYMYITSSLSGKSN